MYHYFSMDRYDSNKKLIQQMDIFQEYKITSWCYTLVTNVVRDPCCKCSWFGFDLSLFLFALTKCIDSVLTKMNTSA